MPFHPESLPYPSASSTARAPWNPVRELKPVHRRIIEWHTEGMSYSRIVYALRREDARRYSNRQLRRICESPKGQEYASLYSAQLNGGIPALVDAGAKHAPEALHHELTILRNPLTADRHRLAAAADLMDRVGPPKISRQETPNAQPTMIVVQLTASQLSQFVMPPTVIDAEVVELLEPPSSADDQ